VCKQSKIRNSLTASRGQAGVPPSPGTQGSVTCSGYLGRQMPAVNVPPSFCFRWLYVLGLMPRGTEYPLGQLGSAVPAVSPPSFCCSPSLLAAGVVWEAEEALTVQQQQKHHRVITLNLKHSTIPATRKKINSNPAETRTGWSCACLVRDVCRWWWASCILQWELDEDIQAKSFVHISRQYWLEGH